jgi:hypothetical protein
LDLLRRAFAILGDTLAAEDEALGHLPEGVSLRLRCERCSISSTTTPPGCNPFTVWH